MRELTYAQAIREGFAVALERDPRVMLTGLGVPDPKGFFGTTNDLHKEFGADRVTDMPCAENGMTGIMLGAAIIAPAVILALVLVKRHRPSAMA